MRCRSCGCTTGLAAPDGAGCPGPLGAGGVCKCHIPRDQWPDPLLPERAGPTVAELVAERDQLRARVSELEAIIARSPPRGWFTPGW